MNWYQLKIRGLKPSGKIKIKQSEMGTYSMFKRRQNNNIWRGI
jgi:hypothetical protein